MYFIYDCNGKVVGNPKGYRTFVGAERQQNYAYSPARSAIWKAYDEKYGRDNKSPNQLVSSIKLVE